MNYYGTTTNRYLAPKEVLDKLGITGDDGKYMVVVKAGSRADANRLFTQETGIQRTMYRKDNTNDIDRESVKKSCDKYRVVICSVEGDTCVDVNKVVSETIKYQREMM